MYISQKTYESKPRIIDFYTGSIGRQDDRIDLLTSISDVIYVMSQFEKKTVELVDK